MLAENDVQIIRLSFFIGLLALFGLLEILIPKKTLTSSRPKRWLNNLLLSVFNSVFLRFLLPAGLVSWAYWVEQNHWGLLSQISLPSVIKVITALFIFDFIIYWQHRVFHHIPWLWRLHRVHHTDMDIDVTTALRFHPIEIAISAVVKLTFITLLGAPALAVLVFEVLLNGSALFNHSNLALPKKLDNLLRSIIVTPDMHRVHHSIYPNETNSNYGFNLSYWDRIFDSYIKEPKDGHQKMTTGLSQWRDTKSIWLHWLLVQPFIKQEKKQE